MSHAGPTDGDVLNRQITGQKQHSGGCNLGAVANVLACPLHDMLLMFITKKEQPTLWVKGQSFLNHFWQITRLTM